MDKQGEGATIRDGATNRMNTVLVNHKYQAEHRKNNTAQVR